MNLSFSVARYQLTRGPILVQGPGIGDHRLLIRMCPNVEPASVPAGIYDL